MGFGFSSFNSFGVLDFLFKGPVAETKSSSSMCELKIKEYVKLLLLRNKIIFLAVEIHYYVCSNYKVKQII